MAGVIHLDKKDERLREYTVYFNDDPNEENPLIVKTTEMGMTPLFVQLIDKEDTVHQIFIHNIRRISCRIIKQELI